MMAEGMNSQNRAPFQHRREILIKPLSKLSYFKIADGSNECKA